MAIGVAVRMIAVKRLPFAECCGPPVREEPANTPEPSVVALKMSAARRRGYGRLIGGDARRSRPPIAEPAEVSEPRRGRRGEEWNSLPGRPRRGSGDQLT